MVIGNPQPYRAKILHTQPANLVAYWPLNGNANDLSGHGLHGTPNANVTWGAGPDPGGGAAVFAGNGYINLQSAGLAAAFSGAEGSLFCWFKVSALADWSDAAYREILFLRADASNYIEMTKRSTANQVGRGYSAGGTLESNNIAPEPAAPLGWVYSAITWSKTLDQVKFYVQTTSEIGKIITSNTLGTWANALTLALIGANSTTPGQPWKGSIAHVALWDTELSEAQIANLTKISPF
jgi:Concanavalin A-like lectin/glucanases superfamily